jgi:SAM-dependent methyltransferase
MPDYLTDFYPESRFGGFSDVDGTLVFYRRVQALIEPAGVAVDFGCGRGAYLEDPIIVRRDARILKGRAARVIGLDADPAAVDNPGLDEFHLLSGNTWPLANETADLVVCDNVLEHLPEPAAFFSEASRVLRAGGCLAIRTPNAWNYVAVISRLVPNRAHTGLLAKVKPQTAGRDIFPTLYRCNTAAALRKMLLAHGFSGVVYGYEAEPSYLAFSKLAYALGVFHQRTAPGWARASLFVFARKDV